MKNAMKKLTSLLLVALLLVGMIPFAASAAGGSVTLVVLVNDKEEVNVTTEIKNDTTTIADLITYRVMREYSDKVAGATYDHAWTTNSRTVTDTATPVSVGETVRIAYYKPVENCSVCGQSLSDPSAHNKTCDVCGETYCNANAHCSTPVVIADAITVVVKVDESDNVVAGPIYKTPANNEYALVENLLTYCWNSSWDGVYEFSHAWSKTNNKTNYNSDAKIYAGDEVHIMLKTKTPTGSTGSTSSGTASNTVSNKFPYNVYLNIYKDTKVGSPDKCIDITNGIALDGRVNVAEVKTVVANYYNANNNYGIGYDGLYLAQGNWVANYVADTQKYDTIEAKEMQQTGYVYINVMISNATAKSSYVADSSNPKTGDSIYTAMTVMGISAASLAAVMYLYNKKRQAV